MPRADTVLRCSRSLPSTIPTMRMARMARNSTRPPRLCFFPHRQPGRHQPSMRQHEATEHRRSARSARSIDIAIGGPDAIEARGALIYFALFVQRLAITGPCHSKTHKYPATLVSPASSLLSLKPPLPALQPLRRSVPDAKSVAQGDDESAGALPCAHVARLQI